MKINNIITIFIFVLISCSSPKESKNFIEIKKIINSKNNIQLTLKEKCIWVINEQYMGEGIGAVVWVFDLKHLDQIQTPEKTNSIYLKFNKNEGLTKKFEWVGNFTDEQKKEINSFYDYVPISGLSDKEKKSIEKMLKSECKRCGNVIK